VLLSIISWLIFQRPGKQLPGHQKAKQLLMQSQVSQLSGQRQVMQLLILS